MTKTRTKTPRTTAKPAPVGSVVYVLDAWDETDQQSVVAVFATRPEATRALTRLLATPGEWYAGIVRRAVR